jgi:hypothetical protein
VAIAAGRVLEYGASPAAWSLDLVAAPLAIGWLAQVLVASWSHLVPAIGPGDMAAHARQRALLGRGATIRVAALNAGVAAVLADLLLGTGVAGVLGIGLCLGSIGFGLALFAAAMTAGGSREPHGTSVATRILQRGIETQSRQ